MCYRYTTSHRDCERRPANQPASLILGWEMGLEPTTPGTPIRCSYQLSYTHHCMEPANGTPGGTRTPGLLLRRQLLYPAELLAHICERTLQRASALNRARKPCYINIRTAICQYPTRPAGRFFSQFNSASAQLFSPFKFAEQALEHDGGRDSQHQFRGELRVRQTVERDNNV